MFEYIIGYISLAVALFLANLLAWTFTIGFKRSHWKVTLLYTITALTILGIWGMLANGLMYLILGSTQSKLVVDLALHKAVATKMVVTVLFVVGFLSVTLLPYFELILVPRKIIHRFIRDPQYHVRMWKIGIITFLLSILMSAIMMPIVQIWVANPAEYSVSFKANLGTGTPIDITSSNKATN